MRLWKPIKDLNDEEKNKAKLTWIKYKEHRKNYNFE